MGTRYTNKDYVSRDNPEKKREFREREKKKGKKLLAELGLSSLSGSGFW